MAVERIRTRRPMLTESRALKEAIARIDLRRVVAKLMDRDHGKGWCSAKARNILKRYRRFLYLTVTQVDPVVPTEDIDELWHAHILDTRAYAADCKATFGFFLHHFPYFGLRDHEDADALRKAFERTSALYEAKYGEPYELYSSAAPLKCASCVTCRGVAAEAIN